MNAADTSKRDLRDHLEHASMAPFQWLIVATAVILNALDGYDVASISFTATGIGTEFGLDDTVLGVVISGTLIGMAVGSIVFGNIADRIGRRNTVLISIVLATAGMYLAATASNVALLGTYRVLTGLGVGGILTSITVITAEFSSRKWRGLAIGLYSAGYGVGATLGGIAAVALQGTFGWRSVFLAGAIVSTAILVALVFILPESVQFLMHKQPAGAQRRLAAIARKVGADAASASLPAAEVDATGVRSTPKARLFASGTVGATMLLWLAFFTTMFGFYFINSWTPRLMVDAGMTTEQGVVVGMALAAGGAAGSVLYGLLAAKIQKELLLAGFMVLSAVAIVVFVLSTSVLALAFIMGVVVGLVVNACIAGLYAVAPTRYATSLRASGVGAALGVGRAGAILAPILAGVLLDAGWTNTALYSSAAALLIVAAIAVTALRRTAVTDPA